jgi:hypothetical protein
VNAEQTVSIDQAILADIRKRWEIVDLHWPWLLRPCTVRILFYADFQGAYNNGGFDGLKEVIATLNADPYYWVRFEISLANRVNDPSADADKRNKTLDQLDLANRYDELWLFGFFGLPSVLSQDEIAAVEAFMNNGGGVLVTGDHEDLGAAVASAIPRAGKLRRWSPAPSQSFADRHSTLRAGPTPGFVFADQSDDVPQAIRLREYPLSSFPFWLRRSMPHPVMCGPDGPIEVLPDHMHEGEVIVPANLPANEWPSVGGFQPQPEIVAWATIVEPNLDKTNQEFGVVGVYDGHPANVGRIGADSTWHHWFDINLIGDNGLVGGGTGFNASVSGQAALRQIEAYFLNMAVWLAPPHSQACMRNRLWWGSLWRDPLFMFPPDTPIIRLGEQARDALGKHAPQCTIVRWIFDLFPIEFRLRLLEVFDLPRPGPPFLEEGVLGAALQPLLAEARERGPEFAERVEEEEVDRLLDDAFSRAVPTGLRASLGLLDDSRENARELLGMVE